MLKVDGRDYEPAIFGFVNMGKLYCEIPGMSKQQAEEVFTSASQIIFTNSDGINTDYTGMRLLEIVDTETPGTVGVIIG